MTFAISTIRDQPAMQGSLALQNSKTPLDASSQNGRQPYTYASLADVPRPVQKRPRTTTGTDHSTVSTSSSARRQTKRGDKEKMVSKEYTAHMWWVDHLNRCKWIQFTPPRTFCENVGFIPVQYVAEVNAGSSSSLSSAAKKRIVQYVLKHGTRGVHYAIGWVDLYYLIRSFGRTCPDNFNLRPGCLNHEIIMSYEGPPLPVLLNNNENQEPPPCQILVVDNNNNNNNNKKKNASSFSSNNTATATATATGNGNNKKKAGSSTSMISTTITPATVASKHPLDNIQGETKKDIPVATKRPRIETEQERQERLLRDDEAFHRAQVARMKRMVMIGFWESRRTSFPSLYHERFPSGIENADL